MLLTAASPVGMDSPETSWSGATLPDKLGRDELDCDHKDVKSLAEVIEGGVGRRDANVRVGWILAIRIGGACRRKLDAQLRHQADDTLG